MSEEVRTMVAANTSGDVTISWTKEQDQEMLDFIKGKLDQGYAFFEIERTRGFLGLIKRERKRYIGDVGELKGRKVTFEGVHDGDISKMLNSNRAVAVTKTPQQNRELKLIRGTNTPDEIVKKNTVMMRPIVGG